MFCSNFDSNQPNRYGPKRYNRRFAYVTISFEPYEIRYRKLKLVLKILFFIISFGLGDRFNREPWRFIRESSFRERLSQSLHQYILKNSGVRLLGRSIYISPNSTLSPKIRLIIGESTAVGSETQLGVDLQIGSHCTINAGAVVRGKVTIGDNVRIATGAQILGFNHGTESLDKPIYKQPITSKGIVIGNDVWVGANSIILDGVEVGSHSVIGAGAVVTKNVTQYSIIGGNPAKFLKSRFYTKQTKTNCTSLQWKLFSENVSIELPEILKDCLHNSEFCDYPGSLPKVRAFADAVELASMFNEEIQGFHHDKLTNLLRSFQDPITGLVPGPYGEGKLRNGSKLSELMECRHSAYMVMAVGYALECLDSYLEYPVHVAANMSPKMLSQHLSDLPWGTKAWQSGAWIDHFSTACYFNWRYHDIDRDLSDLVEWLFLNVDPTSGLWGSPTSPEDWSQPVNGFYRITRGTFSQWGRELPNAEQIIETVLKHSTNQQYFMQDNATACHVLDIIHPLWLCSKQTKYRKVEIEHVALHWLTNTIDRWRPRQGYSFETKNNSQPRLQGTEMWLSIAWYCADLLELNTDSSWEYRPKGIHRPESMWSV